MTEQSRRFNLHQLLVLCRRYKWTINTPDIAGKLEDALASSGFTDRTIRDYVRTAINMLETEKKQGIDLVREYEMKSLVQEKKSVDRTPKSKQKSRANPIYSSPFVQANNKVGEISPESQQNPSLIYIN